MEIKKIRQAVILTDGHGTRPKPFTDTNPMPMYPFNNKPFLEYLIKQVKSFGIEEIILLLGYLPEKIMDYFGDGSKWGINIKYSITPVEYETGLRLLSALDLYDDNFLLMYCDNYCPIDFNGLLLDFCKNDALIELSAYENKDNYTKSNLIIEEETNKVLTYDIKRETPNLKGVDIGYALVNKEVFEYMPNENENFEKIVYSKLAEEGKLYAKVTAHRYYSIDSYERITLTEQFFSNKKYIFLDRDGTINVKPQKARDCTPSAPPECFRDRSPKAFPGYTGQRVQTSHRFLFQWTRRRKVVFLFPFPPYRYPFSLSGYGTSDRS